MPYTGDHIKKEREALDLIIKMKKSGQQGGHGIELFIFVIMPVVLAACVMKWNDIKDYLAHNHEASQVIKMAYPAWEEAKETPPPVLGPDGLPLPPGEGTPATGPLEPGATGETGGPAATGTQPGSAAQPDAQPQAAPADNANNSGATPPSGRGSLLNDSPSGN